jgi:hypothetical protein
MLSLRSAIVLGVSLAAFVASLPLSIPVAGFAFNGWQLNRLLTSTSEAEFVERTEDLPEVKAFLTKFPETKPFMLIDYKVIIIYAVDECDLIGEHCNEARPYVAYLGIVMDNWSGHPARSSFACHYDSITGITGYPLGSYGVLESIRTCDLPS